ncbi:hypothetical protein BGZ99_006539 [Dissophora globulifera]|uniref:Uncharacterized protein n=1 Tax=Dissophora globulifera TaxID=979702 RepID=A0A9P6URZ3_9FUNG|nr:hypothetical protein BGZ99_006539 [Dissophora globulifera]
MYQELLANDANASRDIHDLAQQYNQDLLNGTQHSSSSIEALVMSMALEQDVDISTFSMASQGNPLTTLPLNPNFDPSSNAGQQGSADINQTQLLSGSRS